ncbi:head GIN domain-containing protein [Hymenobacter sp. HD11105]
MKTSYLFCFPLLALLFVLSAFRLDAAEREARDVPTFTQLNLAGSFNVVLRQGSPQKVEVEADPEDLSHVETTVTNGKLRVGAKQEKKGMGMSWSSYNFKKPVTVYVTMPNIEALGVSGSGSMSAADPIRGGNLNLSVSGSGRLKLNRVQADKLNSSVSGSGNISMTGNSAHHDVNISGSGQVDAPGFRSETCRVSISGSGNCRIEVTKTLDASLAGSGNVYVTGKPQINASTAGSGRVRSS